MPRLLAAACCAAFLHAPSMAQEALAVTSYTPTQFSDILDGRFRQSPVALAGKLFVPPGIAPPLPAVVVMHGSGGIRAGDHDVVQALLQAGIAALLLDSFGGRGLSSTGADQGRLSTAATAIDGFAALLALRARPDIDPQRIGIAGFSRGGIAAIFTQQAPLRDAALGAAPGYRAHAALYPSCAAQWEQVVPAASPILFLLGEKDDLSPAAKCVAYADRIRQAGGRAQAIVYPGASHQFLEPGPEWRGRTQNYAACDYVIRPGGEMVYAKTGLVAGADWAAFAHQVFRDCGKWGFTHGGTRDSREQALRDLTDFFRAQLAR
ncbi:dienelactone hydrolase family protein [Ramlibacter sp. PS4R-6]|uniref:dienelactone hydrolase family protein n=1 Tax=Ramlibacter sp. PS4R-6 TaxID=3133438 RepID=UPI0030B03C8A